MPLDAKYDVAEIWNLPVSLMNQEWSGYWLGGYLSITTGKWKWTDGSSFDFQNWKQGFNK